MKPTATPAYRPTAHCIRSSFRSSGKRHLILTGGRGSGKTTLLRALFPDPLPGITTWAVLREAVFLRENASAQAICIARYDETRPGHENKMVLCADVLSSHGVAALLACADAPGEWATIDEIGYLEADCVAYQQALLSLFDRKRVAAVVRKQELPFLRSLCSREDAFVVDLDRPFSEIGCVIMASGLGRRFGGNKLMADFGGQPMICRSLDATQGIFSRRIVVTRHDDIAALCRERGIDVLRHDLPYRSDTIRLGLDALPDRDGVMFCPGDQPLLRQDSVAALALCFSAYNDRIWRAAHGDTPASPVAFPRWAFPALHALPEGAGGGHVIRQHPKQLSLLQVDDPFELMDADTPDMLNILCRQAEQNAEKTNDI